MSRHATNHVSKMILPGAVIGILGTGQLGRMLALEAHRMGYHSSVFGPDAKTSPAGAVATLSQQADYQDFGALDTWLSGVDVVTVEFENIPAETLSFIEKRKRLSPAAQVIQTAQLRLREKQFLSSIDIPVVPFAEITSPADASQASLKVGFPAVVKTAGFGYDGKGQRVVHSLAELSEALGELPSRFGWILEAWVSLDREISVIAGRNAQGDIVCYPPVENHHEHHILSVSRLPARIDGETTCRAIALADKITTALGVCGVLCVEFFVTTDGELLVNELAPRPHNSGHVTFGGGATCSQFELQLRTACSLPLPDLTMSSPYTAIVNLMGDSWPIEGQPDWSGLLSLPVSLHLYGKAEARPGRKMGHVLIQAESETALNRLIEQVQQILAKPLEACI